MVSWEHYTHKYPLIIYPKDKGIMARTNNAKYRLVGKTKMFDDKNYRKVSMRQIEALRDIPRHGVKAGDLGGYVNTRDVLSQEGDCWISAGSVVIKHKDREVSIKDDALVEGNLWLDNSKIGENALVSGEEIQLAYSVVYGDAQIHGCAMIGNTSLFGKTIIRYIPQDESPTAKRIHIFSSDLEDAKVNGCGSISYISNKDIFEATGSFEFGFWLNNKDTVHLLKPYQQVLTAPFKANGMVKFIQTEVKDTIVELSGRVCLEHTVVDGVKLRMEGGKVVNSRLEGIVDISGNVVIYNSTLQGENTICDDVIIKENSHLRGKNKLTKDTVVPSSSHLYDVTLSGGFAIPQLSDIKPQSEAKDQNSNETETYRLAIKSVEADYEAYTTDIVKLIKYPAMADASVPETRELMIALRSARRVLKVNDTGSLEKTARDLEEAFVQAENKAYKLTATFLSDKEKAGLKRAESALAIALDENANEHERRAGYKSGMKSLEGLLPVSDKAVTVLKERIGLKEIEA